MFFSRARSTNILAHEGKNSVQLPELDPAHFNSCSAMQLTIYICRQIMHTPFIVIQYAGSEVSLDQVREGRASRSNCKEVLAPIRRHLLACFAKLLQGEDGRQPNTHIRTSSPKDVSP